MITPHPMVWGLGNTPFAREAAYAELVKGGISASQELQLTDSVLRGWALGDADFVTGLQDLTTRRVSKAAAGRPFKTKKTD
jgi:putative transposase